MDLLWMSALRGSEGTIPALHGLRRQNLSREVTRTSVRCLKASEGTSDLLREHEGSQPCSEG